MSLLGSITGFGFLSPTLGAQVESATYEPPSNEEPAIDFTSVSGPFDPTEPGVNFVPDLDPDADTELPGIPEGESYNYSPLGSSFINWIHGDTAAEDPRVGPGVTGTAVNVVNDAIDAATETAENAADAVGGAAGNALKDALPTIVPLALLIGGAVLLAKILPAILIGKATGS